MTLTLRKGAASQGTDQKSGEFETAVAVSCTHHHITDDDSHVIHAFERHASTYQLSPGCNNERFAAPKQNPRGVC